MKIRQLRYVQFKDVPLPPLHNAALVPREQEQLPAWMSASANVDFGEAGAFYFPVETDKGRRFIIVELGSANIIIKPTGTTGFANSVLYVASPAGDNSRNWIFRLALYESGKRVVDCCAEGCWRGFRRSSFI